MGTSLRRLGIFSLVMITIGSVDSIRNLPATALFGSSLIFFFTLAAIVFLLPSALVSAELASTSKQPGGIYVWVKEAFGPRWGTLAVWYQWIENVIWYPTILAFIAATFGYLVSPHLATNRWFLVIMIAGAFWFATLINLRGMQNSALVANICAILGLLLPMALIIMLGAAWLATAKPLAIHFSSESVLPHWHQSRVWVALTGIMLSFCGMEIATVHGMDVNNPRRSYPWAMLISTILLLVTLLGGSLAIAFVVPAMQISLVAGIMQTFHHYFAAFHWHGVLPVLGIMLIIGGFGGVNNWIIAPTRGLQIAAHDGSLPRWLAESNKKGAPARLLIVQAMIVTLLCAVFLLFPSVNASYWWLSVLAAQLYMIMYVFMFAAALRLRKKRSSSVEEGFEIPGGFWALCVVCALGSVSALVTIFIGFVPPPTLALGSVSHYEILLVSGLVILSLPPWLLYIWAKRMLATAADSKSANDKK